MTWRDQLQAASFRGIPFLVDGDTLSGGRRGPTHEYPYKDKPYNEDMGHKAREYKVSAYVIGDDYFGKRNALINALETRGPGTLIHPQYGMQTVALKSYSIQHSNDRGREAKFDLSFTQEDEVSRYPTATSNVTAKVANLQQLAQKTLTLESLAALADRNVLTDLVMQETVDKLSKALPSLKPEALLASQSPADLLDTLQQQLGLELPKTPWTVQYAAAHTDEFKAAVTHDYDKIQQHYGKLRGLLT